MAFSLGFYYTHKKSPKGGALCGETKVLSCHVAAHWKRVNCPLCYSMKKKPRPTGQGKGDK